MYALRLMTICNQHGSARSLSEPVCATDDMLCVVRCRARLFSVRLFIKLNTFARKPALKHKKSAQRSYLIANKL